MKINNVMAETVLRASVCSSPQNLTSNAATSSTSTAAHTNATTRLQQLKQRKLELDKLLNEKINLLHQLCKQESQLGILKNGYDSDALNNLTSNQTSGVDENLNFFDRISCKEDINKDMLAIHHFNNESSSKLTNNPALLRRGQKGYDSGNQKHVHQGVSALKKKQNYASDSASTGEQNNKAHSSNQYTIASSTANVPIPMERRNSLLLKNSSQRSMNPAAKQQQPVRSDINENEFNNPIDGHKSKTMSYHYHQSPQHYLHIPRDMPVSIGGHHTYQHPGIKKAVSLRSPDTDIPIFDYPLPIVTSNSSHQNQIRYTSDDTIIVSYGNFNNNDYNRNDSTHTMSEALHLSYHTPQPEYFYHHSMQQTETKTHSPNHMTRKYHSQRVMYKKSSSHDDVYDDHGADIISLTPTMQFHGMQQPQQQQFIIADQPQQQGLGGYWHTLENNERVWCSVDSRFASLDRKGQQKLLQKQINGEIQHPSKSISLGNIDVATKQEKQYDSVSISSVNMESKKPKEKQWLETPLDTPMSKYKQHNNLPPKNQTQIQSYMHQDNVSVTHVPPTYYRDKKKLSSQSMHSPSGRSAGSLSAIEKINFPATPTATLPTISMDHLEKTKTIISPSPLMPDYHQLDNYDHQSIYHQQQHHQLSPPPIIPSAAAHLRRTASCVSSTSSIGNNVTTAIMHGSPSNEYPAFNLVNRAVDIRTESPKNMTVIQQAKFQPYKEVTKPFEMSDFYKYSTKFRQKVAMSTNTVVTNMSDKDPST